MRTRRGVSRDGGHGTRLCSETPNSFDLLDFNNAVSAEDEDPPLLLVSLALPRLMQLVANRWLGEFPSACESAFAVH